jgi:hypothetical protein
MFGSQHDTTAPMVSRGALDRRGDDIRAAMSTADVKGRGAALQALMKQVQAEYAEMPGLSLTLPQAQRLWVVDRTTCEKALNHLVSAGLLRRTARGRFVRR